MITVAKLVSILDNTNLFYKNDEVDQIYFDDQGGITVTYVRQDVNHRLMIDDREVKS